MGSQGFRNIAGNPFVYQEDTRSAALGLDAAAQTFKIAIKATAGALPTDTAQLTIDPAASGNVTITPNGTGLFVVGSTSYPKATTKGDVLVASADNTIGVVAGAATAGYVLMANGAGTAPTFQAAAAGGIGELIGDDADTASGASVTIAGGSNITTSADDSTTLTIDLDSSPSVTGSLSAGTTVTAGTNLVSTAGNLLLPTTSSTVGAITIGGTRFMHGYTTSGGNSVYLGKGAGVATYAYLYKERIGIGANSLTNAYSAPATPDTYYIIGIGSNTFSTASDNGNCQGGIAIGYNAHKYCPQNALGSIAIGHNALPAKTGGGNSNIAIGDSALAAFTCAGRTGANNIAIGGSALGSMIGSAGNCSSNIAIGVSAGSAVTTAVAVNNIYIANSGANEANTIRIGTGGTQTALYIAGAYGVTPGGTINVALVDSNHQFGSVANLAVAQGGTGAATLTDHGVLLGSGTGAITPTAVGATGEVLIGNTGADASWSANPTVTSILATTFDTNVAAAAVTLSGTTLSADGTDTDINLTLTPKGAGYVSTVADVKARTLFATGDEGTGVVSQTSLTNVTAAGGSTGVAVITAQSATPPTFGGYIKMYVGTTAVYVPYFTSIS